MTITYDQFQAKLGSNYYRPQWFDPSMAASVAEKRRIEVANKQAAAKAGDLEFEFQNDLAAVYGMTGHPRAGALYGKAYEHGHSSGYNEIAIIYADLVELVLPLNETERVLKARLDRIIELANGYDGDSITPDAMAGVARGAEDNHLAKK